MQYQTLFIAVAALASSTSAFPGHRAGHHHHHHRRAPEAIAEAEPQWDLSNVDWSAAMGKVDWSKVNYGGSSGNVAAANVVQATTTVAVVGAAAPVTTNARPAVATQAAAAGNVVAAVASSAIAAARPAVTTSAATPSNNQVAGANDYTINVINKCSYQVWQAGWQTNTAGGLLPAAAKGNALAAGASITLAVPKNAFGVQIWARTGCSGSGSSFHCDVGDCQGFQCSSIIWQKGPIMAEFGSGLNTDKYNTGITAYDISAIPGNNVGCRITPSISSCETKYCPLSGCDNSQAWHFDSDMNLGSPADTVCSNAASFTVEFCP